MIISRRAFVAGTTAASLGFALSGCSFLRPDSDNTDSGDEGAKVVTDFPSSLREIPADYRAASHQQGTLEDLMYDTYESFSYEDKSTPLRKRAVVYLPHGYSSDKRYNVVYLMHGGWSGETTYLGIPGNHTWFKNVLDNAIERGDVDPVIVVCPTYNNTSGEDSSDYDLAIRLTANYHKELLNDLLPAVAESYSTYSAGASREDLVASRDHRAFMGFSMGSVCTWRTLENALDCFRYFLPSSGNSGTSGSEMARLVEAQGYGPDDFFIYAASGTDDFAYSAFKSQVEGLVRDEGGMFSWAEGGGNVIFLEQPGGTHSGDYACQYFYNQLCWLWSEDGRGNQHAGASAFSLSSTVGEAKADPAFGDFGRLLFPVDRPVRDSMTLEEVSSPSTYVWYSGINPDKTVEVLNHLKEQSDSGELIFYPIYTEEEIREDERKADTGLFFFRGDEGKRFAVVNAGGGFSYVGAMHDSFPHALELSKRGYNAFALIYRPGAQTACEDLSRALQFIFENADALGVDTNCYSLWGGSAGARMSAWVGSYGTSAFGAAELPQAGAVVMQYTGLSEYRASDPPTYACVGTADGIANWRGMQARLDGMSKAGIPTEFHAYEGLGHGFGLGEGTAAEGWIDDAIAFWEGQMDA